MDRDGPGALVGAMSDLRQAVAAAARSLSFERSAHHGWRRIAFVLLAMNVLLTVALWSYIDLHDTVYVTIAATPDGKLIEAQGLDEPVRTDASLKNWTVTAVTEAFTFGHHDWQPRLSAVREYFTDEGYDSFIGGLEESLYLDRIRDNFQVASAVAQGAPVVTDARIFADGRAGWQLEFPMIVTFHAGRKTSSTKMVTKVLVMRVPFDERPAGIGIEQVIATKARRI